MYVLLPRTKSQNNLEWNQNANLFTQSPRSAENLRWTPTRGTVGHNKCSDRGDDRHVRGDAKTTASDNVRVTEETAKKNTHYNMSLNEEKTKTYVSNSVVVNEETAKSNDSDSVSVIEVKTFNKFDDDAIRIIEPISRNHAWVSASSDKIKRLSLQSTEPNSLSFPVHADFIPLGNGDFIVTDPTYRVIRCVTSDGNMSDILSTKPLHPSWISKTDSGDILVTLADGGEHYKLQPSSRRLVQRMTMTGKILHAYELHSGR